MAQPTTSLITIDQYSQSEFSLVSGFKPHLLHEVSWHRRRRRRQSNVEGVDEEGREDMGVVDADSIAANCDHTGSTLYSKARYNT